MKIDFQSWAAPAVILVLLAGLGTLGYTVVYRLPDLEKKTDRVETDVRDQLKSLGLQLVNIRSNLLRVCSSSRQMDKSCKVEELVSQASTLSHLQAAYVDSASLKLNAGETPLVASAQLKQQLVSLDGLDMRQLTTKTGIARLMTWSSAAESAQWVQRDGRIEVKFSNGTASFKPVAYLSKQNVDQLVESLNDTTKALSVSDNQ